MNSTNCLNGKCSTWNTFQHCNGTNCNQSKSQKEPNTNSNLTTTKQGDSLKTGLEGFGQNCFGTSCSRTQSNPKCPGGNCPSNNSQVSSWLQRIGGFFSSFFARWR